MQAARELTPEEIEEGRNGIGTEQFTATQVQALVRQMDSSKKKWKYLKRRGDAVEYEKALKDENKTLYYNYPSLFQMHAEDRLDSTFFEMLQLKRKIEKGEMTSEQASVIVGQKLFNQFVPQAISSNTTASTPKMSYEEYYNQTNNHPSQ